MHPIALSTQINNRSTDIDLLNTHMDCGFITLKLEYSPSYMAIVEYNMSILVMLKIFLRTESNTKISYRCIVVESYYVVSRLIWYDKGKEFHLPIYGTK